MKLLIKTIYIITVLITMILVYNKILSIGFLSSCHLSLLGLGHYYDIIKDKPRRNRVLK